MADPGNVAGADALGSEGKGQMVVRTHTASDGYDWKYRHFGRFLSPQAQVVCIHGIQSHGGWYEGSCTRLCQAGFEVFFLDRRGSGLNERDRGDTPSFRRLLDDLAEFLQSLRTKRPIFLVAISWAASWPQRCRNATQASSRAWPCCVQGSLPG